MLNRLILILITFFLFTNSTHAQSFHTAVAKSPEPGTIFLYPERIQLKEGGFFNAERGMIFVPLIRKKQNSDVIAVEVYRFRRSEKAKPETPPIFFLHGGPSFGGLEKPLEKLGTFEERWQHFLDISDLVVVSQRGIGPSKPTTIIETTRKPMPLDQPYDEKKAVAEYQQILDREKKIWEDLGLDLSGFTVVEAATDVNDVRKALGYNKIVIWGGSFGSHWGMALMQYYPEFIERAIFRGMEGPDHTYDHPGHIWNVYKRIATEAESAPELKNIIPDGGLIKAMETVIKRIKKEPLKITVTNPKTDEPQDVLFDFQAVKRLARGYSIFGLRGWPADVIALYNGDFQKAAKTMVYRYNNSGLSFRTASYWMFDCGSGITAKRLAEYNADSALDIIGSTYWSYASGCSVWDSDLGDDFRQNFETDIPTVIVHGTWDTSTPYENALELVPYFKNSKFIPLKRGPHGAIQAAMKVNEQFKKGIMKFAETGNMSELPDKMELPPVKWIIPKN